MDIQTINSKITRQFPNITVWTPKSHHWKGRSILTGYKVVIDGVNCYVFLGRNGLGRMKNHIQSIVPLYCEIAIVKGGNIEEQLSDQYKIISRLLPEYKKRKSYYRYASFAEDELESAGQKLIDILLLFVK